MRQRELKGWRERERERDRERGRGIQKRERERYTKEREKERRETQKFGCESALVKEGERLREYRD